MIHFFPMPYRATARTEARRADNERRLLEQARALVVDGGFGAVSIAAVADAAGLATGTVYRYFPSKADLLGEVFRRAAAREVDVMASYASAPGRVAERIRSALGVFCERALRSGRLAWALLAEPIDPAVEHERLRFRRAYAGILEDLIRDGSACGELPPQDAAIAASCVVGALGEALLVPLATDDREPTDGTTAAAIDFCLRAITRPSTLPPGKS
jgi:AcrR family transcriptional regulator